MGGSSSSNAKSNTGNKSSTKSLSSEKSPSQTAETKRQEIILNELKKLKDKCAKAPEIDGYGIQIDTDTSNRIKKLKHKYNEYKKNQTINTFMEAVSAHVSLIANTATNSFENSVEQSGTFKTFVEILEDTDIIGDNTYGYIIKELFELYHNEWSLLEETSMAMQLLVNKAKLTRTALDVWKSKIEENKKLTEEQFNEIMNVLTKWFDEDEDIKKLHIKWKKFVEKVGLFRTKFSEVSNGIGEVVKNKFKEKYGQLLPKKYSLAGIAGGVFTVELLKIASFMGGVAAKNTFWTGLLVQGVIMSGIIGCIVFVGYVAHKTYDKNQKIKNVIKDEEQLGKKLMSDLDDMHETAGKIRTSMQQITVLVKSQCGQKDQLLLLKQIDEDFNDGNKFIKILVEIIESLDEFELKCEQIKNLSFERQNRFIY